MSHRLLYSGLLALALTACATDSDPIDDTGDTGFPADGICSPNEPLIGLELTDPGTYDGADHLPGANAMAVNNHGEVTGVADWSTGYGAFIWPGPGGEMMEIQDTDDLWTMRGHAINEHSEVVGHGLGAIPGNGGHGALGFFWSPEDGLRPLGQFGTTTYTYGMNNVGLAVGNGPNGGTVWDVHTGEEVFAGWLSGSTILHDINDAGLAVGLGGSQAVYWTADDGLTALPGLGGGYNQARGVNEDGFIVAEGDDEWNIGRCMLYDPADGWQHPVDLGLLTEPWVIDWCMVEDINIHREVVGADLSGVPAVKSRAWLWQDGVKTDLNDLMTPEQAAEWHLHHAMEINDQGVIVGIATHHDMSRAFVATPICR
jgi:uncharacterized membrane protein